MLEGTDEVIGGDLVEGAVFGTGLQDVFRNSLPQEYVLSPLKQHVLREQPSQAGSSHFRWVCWVLLLNP
jgi:hypothetical protein